MSKKYSFLIKIFLYLKNIKSFIVLKKLQKELKSEEYINKYSQIQKVISYLLIFTILFLNTFNISIFDKAEAIEKENINLISIIVNESIYGSISSKLKRYAQDIQGVLPNTKALIYEVPDNITPQKIAALNEKLFYQGDLDTNSRLIGTILVGKIPLPVIHDGSKTFLSVYPYIDFNEKNFVYDFDTGLYKKTNNNLSDPNPEIWHSIISPNTGDSNKDKITINNFFDKDHSFYEKSGVFSKTLKEPYVFYYDGIRDISSTSYTLFKAYELYLQNIEDITYNRYTKYFAEKINKAFNLISGGETDKILEDASGVSEEVNKLIKDNLKTGGINLEGTPDVMTKNIVDTLTKRFYQIFNEKHIGDILKYVFNTGRYGDSKNTKVDTVISIVSKRDNAARKILKDTNNIFENKIDDILKKGLARNIALPIKVEEEKKRLHVIDPCNTENGTNESCLKCIEEDGPWETENGKDWDGNLYNAFWEKGEKGVIENYYFGKRGETIKNASECSIYRGSLRTENNKSLLVEASRVQNVDKKIMDSDIQKLQTSPNANVCLQPNNIQTMGFWGGYSLLNIEPNNKDLSKIFNLKSTDYRRATLPIYDIKGGKELGYSSETDTQKITQDVAGKNIVDASINNCLEFNYLYTYPKTLSPTDNMCNNSFSAHLATDPYNNGGNGTFTLDAYNGSYFEKLLKNEGSSKIYFDSKGYKYHNRYIKLDGNEIKKYEYTENQCINDLGSGGQNYVIKSHYYFKKILGIVEHKSPTDEEYGAQLMNMATPSLPVDRNRYVNFVSAAGNEKNFEYPNLFRIIISDPKDLKYDIVKGKVKNYLDKKSEEINKIIESENPEKLNGVQKDIYNYLKVNNSIYPNKIDFFDALSKNAELLDEVIKNVLWINLDSTAIKYQYTLENYLDIDGNSPSPDVGHKSDYEIAYIGSKGDSESMYINIDPENGNEDISDPKIASILSKFNQFKTTLTASNVASNKNSQTEFKCGPPDGVPLFEWVGAIMCRLQTLVPPIAIQGGACSNQTLGIGDNNSMDFGGDIPQLTNPVYLQDKDKNGIQDAQELLKDGKITLISEKNMYSYDKNIKIKASLISSHELGSKLIAVDSMSKIKFDIEKLYKIDGNSYELVYDKSQSGTNISNTENYLTYINFNPASVIASRGTSSYIFSSKGTDVDVVLSASVQTKDKNGNIFLDKKSNNLLVKIRGISMDVIPKVEDVFKTNIEAGSNTKIVFDISTKNKNLLKINNQYPINLNITNDITGEKIQENISIYNDKFNFSGDILKKSGIYKFDFTDLHGINTSQIINIIPAKISKIEIIPSTNQVVKGNNVDLLVKLYDSFGNLASGELYNLTGNIDNGNAVFTGNDSNSLKKSFLEGFANFSIKTKDTGKIKVNFQIDNLSQQKDIEIEIIEKAIAKIEIENKNNIKVGGEKHKINFKITDGNGDILNNFSGVAYFDIPEINGVFKPNFVKIEKGINVEDVYFLPNFVAGKDIKFSVQIPGLSEIEGNNFTLLPDIAMYVGLTNNKNKLEAKQGNKTTLKARLYDRYNNIVFNDSSSKIDFKIFDNFKKYISFDKDGSNHENTYLSEKKFSEGIATIDVYSSFYPGKSYVYANIKPSLENNSFEIKDEANKTLTINGISENAIEINTYYLFNKEKLDTIDYNSLYTVLLGSNYGDITHSNYLGGEILFNKNGRSLAVSTVVNDVLYKQKAFGFTPGGKFINGDGGGDINDFILETEIGKSGNNTYIGLYDSVYKELIARTWLNLDGAKLINCGSNENLEIKNCKIPKEENVILLKGNNNVSIKLDGENEISLWINDFKSLSINNNGLINKDPSIKLELDGDSIGNLMGIKINANKEQIGYLAIKFNSENIGIYDSVGIQEALNNKKNQLLIERISSDYSYDYSYLGNSSFGSKGISFHKISESSENEADKALVSRDDKLGLENYTEQAGIGWEDKNKMLLSFASGDNVGEATKMYQTYSMINLGDPIISLKKSKTSNLDFDKTIGSRIYEEKSIPVEKYSKIDFNGDNVSDIVAFYDDGNIGLMLNYGGKYKDMLNLAYISDIGKSRKVVGDFSGDGFEDIVFVNNKGRLQILDNTKGKITRKTPKIISINGNSLTTINGSIQQIEVFDMDNDGVDDIIIVDDSGELSILYGKKKIEEKNIPEFYKKIIDNTLGITLSGSGTNNGGAIYFDGVPQLNELGNQYQYLEESDSLNNLFSSQKNGNTDAAITSDQYKTMLDRLIYYQEKYSIASGTGVSDIERRQAILSAVGTSIDGSGEPNYEIANEIIKAGNSLIVMNGSGQTNINSVNPQLLEKTKTYIKSQFSASQNLEIKKEYRDVNGKYLQSGDLIEVKLIIKNNTNKILNNFIYLDSNKNFLKQSDRTQYTIKSKDIEETRSIKDKTDSQYDLIFDDFRILSQDTVEIKYYLETPQLSFGRIIVGLLENNDNYGDIALNPTNGCGADQLIWSSIASRNYKKGIRKFEDKSKLPIELEKNTIDENKNGIPDYIDELSGDANSLSKGGSGEIVSSYAEQQLSDYNKDLNKNGIPDRDEDGTGDSLFGYDGDTGELGVLGDLSATLDGIDSAIDDLVQGLGCGFGGGACITNPLNWAPMAPGSSMTLFGLPITPGIGAVGNAGANFPIPIFSLLNGPLCSPFVPPTWPPCPVGAGGFFDPPFGIGMSSFRLFITPTLTGGVGTAICFGPNVMAYGFAPGVHPLIPGGQCIVAAMPLLGCSDDGSDGDISSQGFYINGGDNGNNSGNNFYNANSCNQVDKVKSNGVLSSQTQDKIIQYMLSGNPSLAKEVFSDPMVQHGGIDAESGPLIGFKGGVEGEGLGELDVNIDSKAIANLDFGNIIKFNFKRVAAFPDFIMDWVTRQIEEIINKITTLPTLYIILPDFSGFADSGWFNFMDKYNKAKQVNDKKLDEEKRQNEIENQKENEKLKNMKEGAISKDTKSIINQQKQNLKNVATEAKQGLSSIKAAYDVISNLPLINIESETIDINIPWIDIEDVDKWLINAEKKLEQYNDTIESTYKKWEKFVNDPASQDNFKLLLDAKNLVSSIEKNIKILEEYKKFPEKLRKYIMWKEHFLYQILCNIEIINKVIGGRIYDNGKRFKTWVELIVLLKAILKSWQLIIDIFIEFNATCSVCKNERYNLIYWIIKLISALIPQIPVIQFPKWPDIIIDLHNIRAGINILIPEFDFKPVPIVLPNLPDLYLPDTPNLKINISLPQIPLLPALPELPDLPEIPSLPEVKLPDLPPPPKIPKLFGALEAVLKILKLVAKVLCLRKQIGNLLPPEWRAGDAIARITERNGTLPIDFLFIDLPQFSIPFIDAIKVTSYVNLEFDVDFITEMAKSTLEPFNRFVNDASNLNNLINIPDLDLRGLTPEDINIDIQGGEGGAKIEGYNKEQKDKILKIMGTYAGIMVGGIINLTRSMEEQKGEIEIIQFKKILKENISSLANSNSHKERQIFDIIDRAIKFKGETEDDFIEKLASNNKEKITITKNIISNEMLSNSKLLKEINNVSNGNKKYSDLSIFQSLKNDALKINSNNYSNKNELINNLRTVQQKNLGTALDRLYNAKDSDTEEIKNIGNDIKNRVNTGMESFKNEITDTVQWKESQKNIENNYAGESSINQTSYSYDYEGIYITNSSGRQSRLFNYIDEVDKDTLVEEIDFDSDGDMDVIYRMKDGLYLKENLKINKAKSYIDDIESTKDISDINDYLDLNNENQDINFAPNFFKEDISIPGAINFSFQGANKNSEDMYRLEYYDYIERFDLTNNQKDLNTKIDPFSRLNFVDMFVEDNDINILNNTSDYIIRKNRATFGGGVGNVYTNYPNYKLIGSNSSITVQTNKFLYAINNPAVIKYKFNDNDPYKTISIQPKEKLEFTQSVYMSVVSGEIALIYDGYNFKEMNIGDLKGLPVLNNIKLELENKNAYFNINYYNDNLLTVNNGSSYMTYNLGARNNSYSVSFEVDNDFYYGKVYSIIKGKKSTIADLALMSPQKEADNEAPMIELSEGIKIPVYQKQTINLGKYITDVSGIEELYFDLNLSSDSDKDGVFDNDKDTLNRDNKYQIFKGKTWLDLEVGPFDQIFSKKIKIFVKDGNGNISSQDVPFMVYSPVPKIKKVENSSKILGEIDEVLSKEPIDIFRYRNGILQKIDTLEKQDYTNSNGEFEIKTSKNNKGLLLNENNEGNNEIAKINENSGKIDLLNKNKYKISVVGADANNKTKIQIINKEKGNIVYEQSITIPNNGNISSVAQLSEITSPGVYFKVDNNDYKLIKNSINSETLSNGAFVIDKYKKAVIGIGKDGNLYIINKKYSLEYSHIGDDIVINIKDINGNLIGEIMYKINAEFIIR